MRHVHTNRCSGRGTQRYRASRYFAEQATVQLEAAEQLILVGTKAPVGFFAYPGKASEFYPEGCSLHQLATVEEDSLEALSRLVDALNATAVEPERIQLAKPGLVTGELDLRRSRLQSVIFCQPMPLWWMRARPRARFGPMTRASEPHDWISLTGGSIGYGLPVSIGAGGR